MTMTVKLFSHINSLWTWNTRSAALFSTTCNCCGRKSRNPYDRRHTQTLLGKDIPNRKWGTRQMRQIIGRRGDMPQPAGYVDRYGKFQYVLGMVPEFVVPDLSDFKLKPYVSYKVKNITQSDFTAKDLFNVCYAKPVLEDYKAHKITDKDLEVQQLVKKD